MKKRFFLIGAIAILLLLSSCSRTILTEGYPGNSRRENREIAAHLSCTFRKFEVTPKDDLRFYSEIASWLGTPYRHGGTSKRGVDCSGFVAGVYRDLGIASLNRTAESIYRNDVRKISKGRLRTGDLVFFRHGNRGPMSHVGIYLKDGWFVHASSSRGVIVDNLEKEYFRNNFQKGGRIITK